MKKPQSLAEWLSDQPLTDKTHSIINEAIRINDTYRSYMQNKCCAVCSKEFTDEDVFAFSTADYHKTCKAHKFAANKPILDRSIFEYVLKTDGIVCRENLSIEMSSQSTPESEVLWKEEKYIVRINKGDLVEYKDGKFTVQRNSIVIFSYDESDSKQTNFISSHHAEKANVMHAIYSMLGKYETEVVENFKGQFKNN